MARLQELLDPGYHNPDLASSMDPEVQPRTWHQGCQIQGPRTNTHHVAPGDMILDPGIGAGAHDTKPTQCQNNTGEQDSTLAKKETSTIKMTLLEPSIA